MSKFGRLKLFLYDILILLAVDTFMLVLYRNGEKFSFPQFVWQTLVYIVCVFGVRLAFSVYKQILRYASVQSYIRLILADALAFFPVWFFDWILPIGDITFPHLLSISCLTLLGTLFIRLVYRYAYKCANTITYRGRFLNLLLRVFVGKDAVQNINCEVKKINVAIIGAGRVGVALSQEFLANKYAEYRPVCFIDKSYEKAHRTIHSLPVLHESDDVLEYIKKHNISEVVFAITNLDEDERRTLYSFYSEAGCKVKIYDFPLANSSADGKRHLRDFDVEDLLFRKPIRIENEKTFEYYRDKVVLITGGGGSIGSELCRQLAKMSPKTIIILDICENGAYDVQQEIRLAYKNEVDVRIEIASITNKKALHRVFSEYRPDIVINAAAHKHVPLMERNCIEAVENNVFGTKNLIEMCEEYSVPRFMMVSTDKAVNPTNVMGATKRMCEMLVQNASKRGKTRYSATRFGNVLGSAGSVIPLFKRQIASGGPITITDKRIIRYFMTIPEASQLVLESGSMAKNGELFVLDMGQPIRIIDLAQTMIKLSGVRNIEILETGLRHGEKLYEELLVKTEILDRTENSLIFIERDEPLSDAEIFEKLEKLKAACETNEDEVVRVALREAVPTYRKPEEINKDAENSKEMKSQKELATV